MKKTMILIGGLIFLFFFITGVSSAQEKSSDKIIQGAKKEGAVVFWSTAGETAPKFFAPLKKMYPFLKLKVWDSTSTEMVERALAEAQAGRTSVDIIEMSGDYVPLLIEKGLLDKYEWPNTKGWDPSGQPKHGFVRNIAIDIKLPVYNTDIFPPSQAPKSWEDLTDVRFKGKCAVSTSSEELPLLMASMWGEKGKLNWEKSFSHWDKVFKNTQPRIVRGYTGPSQMLGAGEFGLFHIGQFNRAYQFRRKGAPIELVPVDTIMAVQRSMMIIKGSPHPNAARLVADYMTSKIGLELYSNKMFSPVRHPGVSSEPNKIIKKFKIHLNPPEILTKENLDKSDNYWRRKLKLR